MQHYLRTVVRMLARIMKPMGGESPANKNREEECKQAKLEDRRLGICDDGTGAELEKPHLVLP